MLKYPNLYFLFFSLGLSSAIFPSMLGNYIGYIVPLGIGTFVLDELILLISIGFMLIQIFRTQKISYKIGGYGTYILGFIVIMFSLTFISVIRVENSIEIISRDRWIILNIFVIFMPFVYRPDLKDIALLYKSFLNFIIFLALLKTLCLFVLGLDNQFTQFGPAFIFMVSLCLAVFLMSEKGIIIKILFSAFVIYISLLSQQLSAILLTLLSIIIPIYFLIFKTNILPIIILLALGCLTLLFLTTFDLTQIAIALNFNPLNFTIIDKFIAYASLWSTPFIDITPIELFFGRGAGYSMQILAYNEFLDEYSTVNHSLAHNFIVTIIIKYGLMGLFLFSSIMMLIYQPLSKKFKFEHSTLFKIIIFLILLNFLSTPGIWKIRKGFFLWFMIGLMYFYRSYRVQETVKNES